MTVAYAPDRGDSVWLEFTPQTGSEQAGRRPALVISPRAYNAKVGLALFCPVTSRVKGYPFEVALPEGSGVVGVVLADQLKSLDWRARKAKLIERASSEVLAMVTARILPLLVPDLEVRAVFPDQTIEISNFSSLASKPYKHHL